MTDRSNIGSMKTDFEAISKKAFQGSKCCLKKALINPGVVKIDPSLSDIIWKLAPPLPLHIDQPDDANANRLHTSYDRKGNLDHW